MAAAMDLNILWKNDDKMMKEMIKLSFKLGYECVAINHRISDFKHYHSNKKKKQKPPQVKQPSDILLKEKDFNEIKATLGLKKPVRQCSRITIDMDDVNHSNKLQRDEVIRSYDIIAVRPTSDKVFQIACATLDVDIISLDLTDKIPFKVRGRLLKLAMERGIVFEICYAPMIRDSGLRRYVISNGNTLAALCKGRNVIFSSECEKVMELRGPYDVQNLGVLFNMTTTQCKDAVFKNCAKCVTHGETAGKRVSKCIVTVRKLDEVEASENNEENNSDVLGMDTESCKKGISTLKHKLHVENHGAHSPKKKLKT